MNTMMQPITPLWPEDLQTLNLTPIKKESLDNFLSVFLQEYPDNLFFSPPPKNCPFKYAQKEWTLLIDTHFLYNSKKQIKHIILHLEGDQFILGEGAERTVKKCYDLITGLFYAEKVLLPIEKEILNTLNGSHGIPMVLGFYTMLNRIYVIEKKYSQTLTDWINSKSPRSIYARLTIIRDLLEGIVQLHSRNCKHGDIKPDNILLEEQGKNCEAVLTDYGFSGVFDKISGSPIYISPEFYALLKTPPKDKSKSIQEIQELNHRFGHARDIWALGLVFSIIITNSISERNNQTYPPLECVVQAFSNCVKSVRTKTRFNNVTFDETIMVSDIKKLRESFPKSPSLTNTVNTIEKMLSIKPENRPTATQCLNEINLIIAKRTYIH